MNTSEPHDDTGAPVALRRPVRRVVSLVPSLTEAVAATAPGTLVGATQWCTHPAGLEAERVRGTKNPDVRRIRELAPDLVIANKEENRELDVRRLREAGVPVWVTVIEGVEQALRSMRRLFEEALDVPVPEWWEGARAAFAAPPPPPLARAAVCVWRDPWMVVGRSNFASEVLRYAGAANVFQEHADRYPHMGLDEIRGSGADLVVLPDEPYPFSADDGPEEFGENARLVTGRLLTWYGPSLTVALPRLRGELGFEGRGAV
ncbi:helical backbone metal receptor [Nocardiopsis sp. RSe5-2]|uniref:Helical backbone metal receptor n=1 Tax=Nocardiopsis endophytica TaxID=3018445 RepID=A0ABT4UBS1_9ACTN|nr:helical backbone metal receptor [Nocardiopsis endophytica]MDA2814439.1 helical backbone metal receptor [Nocardiopsis endophytica]